jgi:hypothetical protein
MKTLMTRSMLLENVARSELAPGGKLASCGARTTSNARASAPYTAQA